MYMSYEYNKKLANLHMKIVRENKNTEYYTRYYNTDRNQNTVYINAVCRASTAVCYDQIHSTFAHLELYFVQTTAVATTMSGQGVSEGGSTTGEKPTATSWTQLWANRDTQVHTAHTHAAPV